MEIAEISRGIGLDETIQDEMGKICGFRPSNFNPIGEQGESVKGNLRVLWESLNN